MAEEIVDAFPKIVRRPMTCCGLLEAYGFSEPYQRGVREVLFMDGPRTIPHRITADSDQVKKRLQLVIEDQTSNIWHPLNCALISLADIQLTQIREAEAAGFVKVFEFWNPNSGNKVGLYTHTLWKNEEEFHKSDVYKKRHEEYKDDEEDED